MKRPLRPARPPHPYPTKPSPADDTGATHKPAFPCPNSADTHLLSQRCDHLAELPAPLTSNAGGPTVPWGQSLPVEDVPAAPDVPLQRPRPRPQPRPRSKVDLQPISREVKVQTLVKLREDGLATIAARVAPDSAKQDQGKYLTELLEAFSADDWGFPDRHSDSSEHSQSDSEEGEEEEDMATLKARIQAFEQRPVADESHCGDGNNADFVSKKGPEPRPRPRLHGQPSKSVPPAVAPKPKNVLNAPKPSNKMFWEDGAAAAAESSRSADLKTAETPAAIEPPPPPPSSPPKDRPALVSPKPAAGSLPPSHSVPTPAPRPTPPKHATPVSETTSFTPIPPPRPVVSPRASLGSANLPKSPAAAAHIIPALPPRPSNGTLAEARNEETQDPAQQTGEGTFLKSLWYA